MPTSQTEQIARDLLRYYHPQLKQIHGLRPHWLKNPETGHNLEIDIWIPELQAGWEINGVQHGRPTKGLQKDFAAFTKQQRHDRYKAEACIGHGVALYSLTIFDLTQRRFMPFLTLFEATHDLTHDRYLDPPLHLFKSAERLSRAKVVKRRYRKPGLWPLLHRTWKRLRS